MFSSIYAPKLILPHAKVFPTERGTVSLMVYIIWIQYHQIEIYVIDVGNV